LAQLPLFAVEVEPLVFNAYHDESGTYGTDRWFIVAFILVPARYELSVLQVLKQERHGYEGVIHFVDLPGRWKGPYSRKARIARRWLKCYRDFLSKKCDVHILAVDTRSPSFKTDRFERDYHAYNFFTAMAFYDAIPWHFNTLDYMEVKIYSHEKTRRSGSLELLRETGGNVDNFEKYVPWKVKDIIRRRRQTTPGKYPEVHVQSPVITIPSSADEVSNDELREEFELIQLTDVVLGSTAQAIVGGSAAETKMELGLMAADMIQDARRKPWEQHYGLHRQFAVRYFPDSHGSLCENGPLEVLSSAHVQRMM
jgi:hypothetical protein